MYMLRCKCSMPLCFLNWIIMNNYIVNNVCLNKVNPAKTWKKIHRKIRVENCNEFPEESPGPVPSSGAQKKANHFMTSELEEQVGKPRCRCCVIYGYSFSFGFGCFFWGEGRWGASKMGSIYAAIGSFNNDQASVASYQVELMAAQDFCQMDFGISDPESYTSSLILYDGRKDLAINRSKRKSKISKVAGNKRDN